jgi:hypothetical protein
MSNPTGVNLRLALRAIVRPNAATSTARIRPGVLGTRQDRPRRDLVITGVNAPARTTRARTAANRRLLADFFDGLDEDQLRERSLCDAWTVREILGHLVMPLTGSVGAFLRQVVQARGSLDRASVAVASEIARRPGR